jgi:hypothetical protein
MERNEIQELIDAAARGDAEAAAKLRRERGRFENKRVEDIPPMFREAYRPPDPKAPKSLDALRAEREYNVTVVDDFVSKACSEQYLPPGAAMMLFVVMCTKYHSGFQLFGGPTRMKMKTLFQFWDEAHPWVKANILYKMREHLYKEHHLIFCRAFAAKARQYDKIKEEETKLPAEAEVLDVHQKKENADNER